MRKSPRIAGFDYANTGTYFVTICTRNMERRFGDVVSIGMVLNEAGTMIASIWGTNADRFPGLALDMSIVMPNHIHAIVHVGANSSITIENSSITLLIQTFKSLTTLEYGKGVRESKYPSYDRSLWQRSFYDRMLRSDEEIEIARRYIDGNPGRWFERHAV
ncbi:MAG: transposase [Thermomicrobiales bacterium]